MIISQKLRRIYINSKFLYNGLLEITDEGRVFIYKNKKKRECKYRLSGGSKYYAISFNFNGKQVSEYVHRLVAEAFIPNPNNKPQVNHMDRNTLNNNVKNLEWCTAKENTRWMNMAKIKNVNYKLEHLRKSYSISVSDIKFIFSYLKYKEIFIEGRVPDNDEKQKIKEIFKLTDKMCDNLFVNSNIDYEVEFREVLRIVVQRNKISNFSKFYKHLKDDINKVCKVKIYNEQKILDAICSNDELFACAKEILKTLKK